MLIATPLAVYIISFLAENYLFGQNVSFESISDSSILDDIILILGNLLIILLFLKKRWTNVNESCSRTAMASFDKGLLLWILILELSAILPTNLFVGILNLSDFDAATSDSATSMAAVVGICLLAPFAEELVMRGGVEEHLLHRPVSGDAQQETPRARHPVQGTRRMGSHAQVSGQGVHKDKHLQLPKVRWNTWNTHPD